MKSGNEMNNLWINREMGGDEEGDSGCGDWEGEWNSVWNNSYRGKVCLLDIII